MAFHGRLAAASYAQSVAVGLLVVSAVAPAGARTGIGIAAVVLSFAARVTLARGFGARVFSVSTRSVIAAIVALTVLFFVGTTIGGRIPGLVRVPRGQARPPSLRLRPDEGVSGARAVNAGTSPRSHSSSC